MRTPKSSMVGLLPFWTRMFFVKLSFFTTRRCRP